MKHPIRVFLVDDDEDDFVLIRDFLEETEKTAFDLTWVDNYDQALTAILANRHDVYLLDYRLGDRDGLQLLREALKKGCQAPIILLTGQGDYEIDIEAMKAGAADYLDKSSVGADLLERSLRYAVERDRAEQKIREQATLLDVATDAIFLRDFNNSKILYWNKGSERLYGWKAEEAIGQSAKELLYRSPFPFADIQKALLNKGEWQGELQQISKEGKDIIIEGRWTLVRGDANEPKQILTVNTDITQRKQLEAQFLRAQRLESIGTLAGGVAHDLNNILSPILMTVQLLRMKEPDQKKQRWLDIIETSAKRGADLVKQVLSFSRGLKGERTVLQIGHLISEIHQIIKQTFPKFVHIQADYSTRDLRPIEGDATQLQQVLMNLCVNARDAMPDGGELDIIAENVTLDENYARIHVDAKPISYVRIKVSDTGTGIPPSIMDRIFDPFFTTKDVGKGTGLGLSTVIGIIKSHNGFLNVYSEVNQGTEFTFYLPVAETPENAIELRPSEELTHGKGEVILVVDDEIIIREATQNCLESYSYHVILAANGAEAIALYSEHQTKIDLVIIDMMMPFLDGAKTIRALERINPQIKIIAVSGLSSNRKVAENAGKQVKDFLTKPYTTPELLQSLDRVLHSKSG